jgi:hypothetical protein
MRGFFSLEYDLQAADRHWVPSTDKPDQAVRLQQGSLFFHSQPCNLQHGSVNEWKKKAEE